MRNLLFLSACLIVMAINTLFAMDTDKPLPVPTTLAPLLTDQLYQDPLTVMLSQLDLESTVNTLMTNKATATNTELWEFLAEFHGVSAGEGQSNQDAMLRAALTLRDMKQKMSAFSYTNMQHFLKEAMEKPYLWSTLLESLPQIYPCKNVEDAQAHLNYDASSRQGMFAGTPAAERLAYLEKVVTHGIFGAEQTQTLLSIDASLGEDLFKDKTAAERRAYLEKVVMRRTFGAEQAQEFLNRDASSGSYVFAGIPVEERHAYLEGVVKRGTFGAEDAQGMLKKLQTKN